MLSRFYQYVKNRGWYKEVREDGTERVIWVDAYAGVLTSGWQRLSISHVEPVQTDMLPLPIQAHVLDPIDLARLSLNRRAVNG